MKQSNHHNIRPTLRVGKAGITDNTVKQAKEQLKKMKIIKVKFLPTAIKENKKELAKELATRARAKIVHAVGFVVVLERIK